MDAEIQAKDGNSEVRQMLDSNSILPHRLPSMCAGFRHPCRNDGLPMLVHESKRRSVGMMGYYIIPSNACRSNDFGNIDI